MPEKKQETFTVTDRRAFTMDGENRQETSREESVAEQPATATAVAPPPASAAAPTATATLDADVPPPPTDAEQQAQADAYQKSAKELDARVELSGHSAQEMRMTFERFMASFYMSAMVQLGLMHEQGGQPRIDIIGARQTIDTIGLLSEKTKGNLTAAEENFMQNSLYELRMAYVEVTNALSRPPQVPPAGAGTHKG